MRDGHRRAGCRCNVLPCRVWRCPVWRSVVLGRCTLAWACWLGLGAGLFLAGLPLASISPASISPASLSLANLSLVGAPGVAAAEEVPDDSVSRLAATPFSPGELQRILRMAPLPELPRDASNAVADDPRAARLGERLFFDRRLSADGERSCASCHDPRRHWADGRPSSTPPTTTPEVRFPRNAPSLWNSAYNRWFSWDGRADSAWSQALGPLEAEAELGSNRLQLLHLVRGDPELLRAYGEIFGPLPEGVDDPRRFPADARPLPDSPEHPLQRAWGAMHEADRHGANVVFTNLGKALAAFQRGLVVRDTPLDRFVTALRDGGGVSAAPELSPAAVRGLRLFVGRGQCTLCHSGPLLSDGEFHDVGIALTLGHRVDSGRYQGVLHLLQSSFTQAGPYADAPVPAAPVRYLEQKTHQLGQFKTPSLRGAADTAPYMHDGRFATLEEVVRFYDERQGAAPLGHPTTLLQPLGLTDGEVADLVAFLSTLTHGSP
jgi:cytochrome c peroxidase